jgi:hypothetical protein
MTDELSRLEEEVRQRKARIKAIKLRNARAAAKDLETFEALDGHAKRQLYEDDPDTYRAFMKQLQEMNEQAFLNRPFPGSNRRES